MSQEDLWAVIGRAKTDGSFATALMGDAGAALRASGYQLTPSEQATARVVLSGNSAAAPALPLQQIYDTFTLQQDELRKRTSAQSARMINLNDFTACTLKETIGHAASTYRKITIMNQVMFWMGVSLYLFAVVYASITRNLVFSIAFAGLGTVSFIGFFFLGPIQQTQAALSNLISAEIAFMNFFEQMGLIESYACTPRSDGTSLPDPVRMEHASEMMQERSRQTVKLLQRYIAGRSTPADAAPAVPASGHPAAPLQVPPGTPAIAAPAHAAPL